MVKILYFLYLLVFVEEVDKWDMSEEGFIKDSNSRFPEFKWNPLTERSNLSFQVV